MGEGRKGKRGPGLVSSSTINPFRAMQSKPGQVEAFVLPNHTNPVTPFLPCSLPLLTGSEQAMDIMQ